MTIETAAAPPAPPTPTPDEDSAPYWAALAEHRVLLPICDSCSARHFPPTPACPHCGHPHTHWEEVPATGSVYSFITVHRAFDPAFADQVPYVIATVDLQAGVRTVGRLSGTPAIGARVSPEFTDHDGWTELRFRVVES
ncbi:Zn-ribbon domain-containing OB-fold protein [Amycolatopsis echigonensis]|uniref:OB-fold domain-containing protein n=1 Tax=Amycolatopsis echigonensis TaxID=2576905 RepID=A0A8E1W7G6_9PSEU|nr:OB-fold domain-containing protein [Amycolatopsis echigonensis]MBB2505236.1 OB-fold domain-containing protein [Amycolatopsis echigonensis]